ncbi:hypothetical protein VKS41_008556 [Umbelopsis sp. WA50703]
MESLPYDIQAYIFCFVTDPYQLSQVSRQYYNITQDPVCIARRLLVLYGRCFESQVLEPVMMPSAKVTQILLDNGATLPRHFVQKLENGYYEGMLHCTPQSLDVIENRAMDRFGPRFESAEDESQLVTALLERMEQCDDQHEKDQLHDELYQVLEATDYVPVTLGIKDSDLVLILRLITLAPKAFKLIHYNGFTLRNITRVRDFVTLLVKVGHSSYAHQYTIDEITHALQILYDQCNLDIQPQTMAQVFEKITSPEYLGVNRDDGTGTVCQVLSKLKLPFDLHSIAQQVICRTVRDCGCLFLYETFPCEDAFTEAFLQDFTSRDCSTANALTSHYACRLLDIFGYPHPVTQRSFDIVVHRLILATFGNEYPLKQKKYRRFSAQFGDQVTNSAAPIDRENRAFHYYLNHSSARLTNNALTFDGREYTGTVDEDNKQAMNIIFDAILRYGVSQWPGATDAELSDGKTILKLLLQEERKEFAQRNGSTNAEDAVANQCILSTFHATLEEFYKGRIENQSA